MFSALTAELELYILLSCSRIIRMSTDGIFSCLKPKTSQDEADFSYQPSEYNNNPESEIYVVPCTELFQGNDIYQISNGSFRGKAMIGRNLTILGLPVEIEYIFKYTDCPRKGPSSLWDTLYHHLSISN